MKSLAVRGTLRGWAICRVGSIWQLFAEYPLRLAGLTLLCMLVLGRGLRVLLASASRRRLKEDQEMTQMKKMPVEPCSSGPSVPCPGPGWPLLSLAGVGHFRQHYISEEGSGHRSCRGAPHHHLRAELRPLLRPLVNDDRETFARLLDWTERAARPRSDRLPRPGLLGAGSEDGSWGVLDEQRVRLGSLDSLTACWRRAACGTTTATRPLGTLLRPHRPGRGRHLPGWPRVVPGRKAMRGGTRDP